MLVVVMRQKDSCTALVGKSSHRLQALHHRHWVILAALLELVSERSPQGIDNEENRATPLPLNLVMQFLQIGNGQARRKGIGSWCKEVFSCLLEAVFGGKVIADVVVDPYHPVAVKVQVNDG